MEPRRNLREPQGGPRTATGKIMGTPSGSQGSPRGGSQDKSSKGVLKNLEGFQRGLKDARMPREPQDSPEGALGTVQKAPIDLEKSRRPWVFTTRSC